VSDTPLHERMAAMAIEVAQLRIRNDHPEKATQTSGGPSRSWEDVYSAQTSAIARLKQEIATKNSIINELEGELGDAQQSRAILKEALELSLEIILATGPGSYPEAEAIIRAAL